MEKYGWQCHAFDAGCFRALAREREGLEKRGVVARGRRRHRRQRRREEGRRRRNAPLPNSHTTTTTNQQTTIMAFSFGASPAPAGGGGGLFGSVREEAFSRVFKHQPSSSSSLSRNALNDASFGRSCAVVIERPRHRSCSWGRAFESGERRRERRRGANRKTPLSRTRARASLSPPVRARG